MSGRILVGSFINTRTMKQNNKQSLINLINECAQACNNCATACLNEEDVQMLTSCIRLDVDCADICRTTAAFLERSSDNSDVVLSVCALICDNCGDECEKHSHMKHCKICAEVCRQCAESCRQTEGML